MRRAWYTINGFLSFRYDFLCLCEISFSSFVLFFLSLLANKKYKGDTKTPLADPLLVSLAEEHQCLPSHIILHWFLKKGWIPIPKSSNNNRLYENIRLFQSNDEEHWEPTFNLSDEEMNMIDGFSLFFSLSLSL